MAMDESSWQNPKGNRLFPGKSSSVQGLKYRLVWCVVEKTLCCHSCPHIYCWYGCFQKQWYPKSSILIGFSIINHPFWGTTLFRNIHMTIDIILLDDEFTIITVVYCTIDCTSSKLATRDPKVGGFWIIFLLRSDTTTQNHNRPTFYWIGVDLPVFQGLPF